ncbi:hypothetical protein [Brevibacillus sp. H7]|uniref:hypothetical protein n=1 Tax=Brevibacillus sp. H7 TaxID=3349138 RepID=UPI00381AC712
MFGFLRRPTVNQHLQPLIPDWLYGSVQSKVTPASKVKHEDIKVMVVSLRGERFPLVAAYVNEFNKQGVFILYKRIDGTYREVYVKEIPVHFVQVYGDLAIVVSGRAGSSPGILRDEHFIIRQTPSGYKEVWNGMATYVKMLPEVPPLFYETGSVLLDQDGRRLLYTTLRETYHRKNLSVPMTRQSFYQIYRYSEESHIYILQTSG